MTERGEKTRQKILDEATLVFNRKGFGATTINDLLEATGTTKGNLYFHFSGKEAVGLEVLKREQESFYQFLNTALEAKTPGEGLDNFFIKAVDKHHQNGFVGGCLFGNIALETSDTYPAFAALVQAVFAEWIAKLERNISAAQASGEIRADLSAGELAELVVATIEGGIMQARLVKSAAPFRRSLDALRKVLELEIKSLN